MESVRPMPPLPKNMEGLPIDPKRGFVVPAFVQWIDGVPDFRLMNHDYLVEAIRRHLCWMCAKPLGKLRGVFVIGPMCAVNRNTAEPPCHPECARYAAKACPFLTRPHARRREDELSQMCMDNVAGVMIKRNPGVTLLWFARDYHLEHDPRGFLFKLGPPVATEWYCEGREATRAEVLHSIDTGLPILRNQALEDGPEAVQMLERWTERALRLVPA
jgi:hypothetical protein